MRDAVGQKLDRKFQNITELKEKIRSLEKCTSQNVILKQFKIEFNNKLSEIQADMI